MVDDYGGYKTLFGPEVVELGCLAYAQRKFFELHKAGSSIAEEALECIAELYVLECQARDGSAETRLRTGATAAARVADRNHA